MADNPIETAANELKKWLDQLKKIMALMEANEKALKSEQKAIGDKALAAHKEMVAKTKHDELIKELKDIKQGIKNTPEGTPGKEAALKEVDKAENKLDVLGKKQGLNKGQEKGIGGNKETTGQAIGWKKGESGWKNGEGLSTKQLSTGIKLGSRGIAPGKI